MNIQTSSLINGDCLEEMKKMADKSIDLILTDPPYGINIGKNGSVGGGSTRGKTQKFDSIDWDNFTPEKKYFDEMFRISKNQIIWGGNYFIDKLYPTRCMLIWYKRDGLPTRTFADCEIAWTSFDKNSRVLNSRWDGFIRDSKELKLPHPTQKSLEVMEWCINELSEVGMTILDPFMGSGTTGVACKNLNRNFIGIEINKNYFEISKKRIDDNLIISKLF